MSASHRRLSSVAFAVASCSLATALLAGGEGGGIHQTLNDTSVYTSQGCFAPCMCLVYDPPHVGTLGGTFTLRFSHQDTWTSYYDVVDVSLNASNDVENNVLYTGTGTYEIGGDFVLTERMVLTLTPHYEEFEGEPLVFDSGYKIVTGEHQHFPNLSIELETEVADCQKRWMKIDTTAAPPCAADIGGTGGEIGADNQLDNNDFVVFIDLFFNANPLADRGAQGGQPGMDGEFDNNDFIVFIDQFFEGC